MDVIVITDDMEKWDRLVSNILNEKNDLWRHISQTTEIKYYPYPNRPLIIRGSYRVRKFSTNDVIKGCMRGHRAMALIVDKEFMEKIKDKETIKKNFGETFTNDYMTELYITLRINPYRDDTLESCLFNHNPYPHINIIEF